MLASTPTPELDALTAAVHSYLLAFERSPSSDVPRSREDLGDDLRRTRVLINRLELVFARTAARFAPLCDPELDENPTSLIRQECRMTSHAAITALQVGALERQLPAGACSAPPWRPWLEGVAQGCERPASWAAAHHIVHWAHGGRTDLRNLVLLCHRHHLAGSRVRLPDRPYR